MNKNIRIFIYVSLFIHLFGGAVLYMYYFNPSAPQPLGEDRAEEPRIEKDLESPKVRRSNPPPHLKDASRKRRRQMKGKALSVKTPRSRNNSITPENLGAKDQSNVSFQKTDSSGKTGKVSLNSAGTEKGAQKLSEEGTLLSPKTSPPSGEISKGEEAFTKKVQEDGEQESTPTGSALNQKNSLTVKDKKEQTDSSNALKYSFSSSKFRDFLDLKQKRGNPKLDYPREARKQKIQGRVSIIYFVDPEGLVDKIQLERTSGHSLLDNFVLRTIARYEFLPHQEGWVRHTVDFILRGEEEQTLKFRNKDQ